MKQDKSLKLILPILLILLMSIGILSGCLGNYTTPDTTVPDETSGEGKVLLRVTYKEIDLNEGNFSLEICSLNQIGFNASGFTYNYYDSEGSEITELSNYIGIPFDVVPATSPGTPGSPTAVNNIPLYFNEVENYFIAHPNVKLISCTVNLIGTDSLGNEISVLIMSNIPIIEQGVEIQEVNAVIQTTPDPPTGEVPLTVHFDAGSSTTEDVRGVAKYCWHFGDGSYGTCFTCSCPSELECPMHTYTEPGTYVASLCVWDYNDNLDCAAVVVTVNAIQMNMTVTANPATIAPKETSIISAYLTDQYDNPIPDGTKVAFYTNNGTLSANFANTVGGIATVVLTLNEPVIATVTAVCNDASGSITVRAVELGITVTANPATISPGDFSTISAYLVDSFVEPVPDGTTITFSTSEGILSSNFAVTTAGIATVELQLSRITTAIITANYGTVSGSTTVTCTDGPIAIIGNDTDDQISPIEITANSDCPYAITFNAYKSIPGTSPPLTYKWTMTHPDGTVEDLGTAVVTAPYVFDACGIYVITLTVTDSCTNPCPHSDTATMRIIVTNPEGPTAIITSSEPMVGSTISITANSDCAYPVTFWGDYSTTTAICGDITDYSWEIIDPNGVIVSGTLGGTPTGIRMIYSFDTCGTYVVELTVTDGCGKIASTFVTVIVSEPEGPTAVITSSEPIVNSAITVTANSDCPYSITFYGHESSTILECGDITAYAWQIIDPNGAEETDFDTYDLPDGIKMVYANFNICGVYAVKLTVTDACGNTDSEALSVIVKCPEGPTAVITGSPGNIEACDGCPYPAVFNGNSSTPGADCGGLTYAWSIAGPVGAADFATKHQSTASYSFVICGTYTITLEVTDDCNNTDSTSVTLTVTEPADPVAVITNTTDDQVSPIEITACSGCPYEVGFDGTNSTSSASCGGLIYAWSIARPDGAADFVTKDQSTANYAFEVCGTYKVTLTVTDSCGNTDSAMVSVIVTEPDNPVAVITNTESSASPIQIQACTGCPYTIGFNGTSSTTSALCGGLTYAWTIIDPAPSSPTSGTDSTISYNFTKLGTHTVTLTVTDGCGNTDSEMVVVIVSDCCPAAAFSYTPTSPVLTNQMVQFDASGSFSDCGCGVVTYEWDWTYDGITFNVEGTGQTTTHAYTTAGTYTVALRVTDACGKTAMATMDVVVVAPAAPLAAIDVISIDGLTVSVSGANSTTGCPGGMTTYGWSWGDATTDGSGMTSGHTYAAAGVYTITLTVDDACGGGPATATVDVNVPPPANPIAVVDITNIVGGGTVNVSGINSTTGCPGGITSYQWNWGDGSPLSSGATSAHTYASGLWTITLIVTDNCGKNSTATAQVIIP